VDIRLILLNFRCDLSPKKPQVFKDLLKYTELA